MGPFLFAWYEMMNRIWPDVGLLQSLLKCLCEQVSLEPICIVMYLVYDGVVRGRGWGYCRKRVEKEFGGLLIKNALFWLPANFCNYYLGTQELRVVFSNLCAFFWNVYFSARVNSGGRKKGGVGSGVGEDVKKKLVVTTSRDVGDDEQVLPHTEILIV